MSESMTKNIIDLEYLSKDVLTVLLNVIKKENDSLKQCLSNELDWNEFELTKINSITRTYRKILKVDNCFYKGCKSCIITYKDDSKFIGCDTIYYCWCCKKYMCDKHYEPHCNLEYQT